VHAHADKLGGAGGRVAQKLAGFAMAQVRHDLQRRMSRPQRNVRLENVLQTVDATGADQSQ
jgi:hypothetical protein